MARAVIFDMDGTLLDTEPMYLEAEGSIVREATGGDISTITHLLLGTTPADSARIVVDHFKLSMSAEAYLEERSHRLKKLMQAGVPLMPGMAELLAHCAAIPLRLAIATSSSRELMEIKLRTHADVRQMFESIVCSDDIPPGRGKPCPDTFLQAAGALQVQPEQCLVLEDAPAGIHAARAAGMKVACIRNPHVSASIYADANPDQLVDAWLEIDLARFGIEPFGVA
ncbi:putative pseudouridine-5'-phosphatase [Porphyridium purpureum]|uniref:Putative pseudouridine-5'-phosphatase n=1 Tax=Porphyridium purpureum TaxID=35688 RepID=A0A5J4ZAF8_PORPP|nr:putative pseudouridine-5'-phosphatase [Porphyridium purpureum]|eukprot:POR6468..scf295_1